jgi:hypothetical protein
MKRHASDAPEPASAACPHRKCKVGLNKIGRRCSDLLFNPQLSALGRWQGSAGTDSECPFRVNCVIDRRLSLIQGRVPSGRTP